VTPDRRQQMREQLRAGVIEAMGAFLRAPLNEATAKKKAVDAAFEDYDQAVLRSAAQHLAEPTA
jgi:hypothetical protein